MIIGFSEGGFGNQLFQLSGLLTAQKETARGPNEIAVALGFQDIPKQFNPDGLVIVRANYSSTRLRRFLSNRFQRFVRQLARFRLFSEIWVDAYYPRFVRTRAVFPQIGVITNRFLQVANLSRVDGMAGMVSELLEGDYNYLMRDRPFVFLHVRRGDYLTWPTPDAPAALPTSFFSRGLIELRKKLPATEVLVFSDDPEFVTHNTFFKKFQNLALTPLETFLTMAQACGGIISPSSFSYWAALVATERGQFTSSFIAPLYWVGWRREQWWPKKIYNSKFQYLEVGISVRHKDPD